MNEPKPSYLKPNGAGMPAALKDLPQWLDWRGKWVDGKDGKPGKWDKPPFRADGSGPASSTDPATWGTFLEAAAAYKRGGFDGVGFVLWKKPSRPERKPDEAGDDFQKRIAQWEALPESDSLCGFDFDDSFVAPSGEPTEEAREYLNALNSYTERSPSGKGFRVFVMGKLPPEGRKRGDFECYEAGRYLTVTGNRLEEYPATIEARQEAIDRVHAHVWPPKPKQEKRAVSGGGVIGDDAELLSKMFTAKNGDKARALYGGDTSGYPGASEADQALCSMLAFWTGCDAVRMDRLFRASALMRDKWDEARGVRTYGERTIDFAVAHCSETYSPPGEASADSKSKAKRSGESGEGVPNGTPDAEETALFTSAPRALTPQLRAVPPLLLDMIPGPIREWISDIAERGSFPAEYVAAPALVALSAVVGRRVGIRPKRYDDWTVVPNLFGAVVGPPGALKTGGASEAIRPLTRLETDAREQYEREAENHRAAQFLSKTKADAAKDSVKKAVKSRTMTEQELQLLALEATADETIEPPICTRYTVNDATVEKLGELLKENPNGLLMFRDELTGWLKTLDRQGHEADRAFYLEAWNGTGGYTYDRIGRGTTRIDAACISLFGTIQPGPLARYLRGSVAGEDADGLASRLQILVYPDPPIKFVNVDRYAKTDAKNRAYLIFKRLSEMTAQDIGATVEGEGIPFLKFDSAAQDFFDAWRTDLENRLRSGRETAIVTTHLSKYRSLLPSLALLFHLIDDEAGGDVSLPSVTLAARWCDFLEAHTRRVYQSAMDGDTETAQMLADRIAQSLPNPFRPRDVQRKGWAGLKTPDEVETAIGILEDRGWLRTVEKPSGEKGGRPSVEVYINPAVLDGSVSFVSTSDYESHDISEQGKEGFVSSVSTQTHTNGDFPAGGKKSDGGGYENTYLSTTINNCIVGDTKNSTPVGTPTDRTDRTLSAPEKSQGYMAERTDKTDKTPPDYAPLDDDGDLSDPFAE